MTTLRTSTLSQSIVQDGLCDYLRQGPHPCFRRGKLVPAEAGMGTRSQLRKRLAPKFIWGVFIPAFYAVF